MRPDEDRTFAPSTVDCSDDEAVRAMAERFDATPDEVREAVANVGCNGVAVELWLTAPAA